MAEHDPLKPTTTGAEHDPLNLEDQAQPPSPEPTRDLPTLPCEVWVDIAQWLDFSDLYNVYLSSKAFALGISRPFNDELNYRQRHRIIDSDDRGAGWTLKSIVELITGAAPATRLQAIRWTARDGMRLTQQEYSDMLRGLSSDEWGLLESALLVTEFHRDKRCHDLGDFGLWHQRHALRALFLLFHIPEVRTMVKHHWSFRVAIAKFRPSMEYRLRRSAPLQPTLVNLKILVLETPSMAPRKGWEHLWCFEVFERLVSLERVMFVDMIPCRNDVRPAQIGSAMKSVRHVVFREDQRNFRASITRLMNFFAGPCNFWVVGQHYDERDNLAGWAGGVVRSTEDWRGKLSIKHRVQWRRIEDVEGATLPPFLRYVPSRTSFRKTHIQLAIKMKEFMDPNL